MLIDSPKTTPQVPPSSTFTDSDTAVIATMIEQKALSHVAIIMDGNRRWAKNQNMPSIQGHFYGYKALKAILKDAGPILKLPVMTVYAFSTENWKRSEVEVSFLMKLLRQTLLKELDELIEMNIQLRFIGQIDAFPKDIQTACREAEERTAACTGLICNVALSYGGRAEITRACREMAQAVEQGTLKADAIDETTIQTYLYTSSVPDPDLIIRTGGEYRLSNFLLWQAAFAELYTTSIFWPDFTPDAFRAALLEFHHRQRRFGQ